MTDEEKLALGYSCCLCCRDEEPEDHTEAKDQHAVPCPNGCNADEVAARA